jgi:fido (protein-threonine AMPylation protein)
VSDEVSEHQEQSAIERREARFVFARIKELFEGPIAGNFDAAHLKAVHAYLFQDHAHGFHEGNSRTLREFTDDRLEYEASFVLTRLRREAGRRTLEAIIRDGMTRRR